jgi:hypothetical protein
VIGGTIAAYGPDCDWSGSKALDRAVEKGGAQRVPTSTKD